MIRMEIVAGGQNPLIIYFSLLEAIENQGSSAFIFFYHFEAVLSNWVAS